MKGRCRVKVNPPLRCLGAIRRAICSVGILQKLQKFGGLRDRRGDGHEAQRSVEIYMGTGDDKADTTASKPCQPPAGPPKRPKSLGEGRVRLPRASCNDTVRLQAAIAS